MRIKKLKSIFFLGVVLLTTLLACKKEQPAMNEAEDPCECASEVSADFEIREALLNGGPVSQNEFTLTDHILENKRAFFKAKLDNADYTWYIGVDVEHDQEIDRYFTDQWAGTNIPITLVVKKEPNLLCFPDDDGYDSITKVMHVYPRCDTNHLEGEFRIAEVGTQDSFDIKLNIRGGFENNVFLPNSCFGLDFYNYDGQGGECVMNSNFEIVRNYRFFRLSNPPNSNCTSMNIIRSELDLSDKFYFHYNYRDENNNLITLNTQGRKL